MAGTNRDVELAFKVSTLGEEGIRRLEQDIRELAAQGGDAAPQFERLADEVARLGQQARQLDEFSRLTRDINDLSDAQNVAAETSAVLYKQLQDLQAATNGYREAQTQAQAALKAGQNDLQATKDSIRLLRIETDAAGKDTDAYRAKLLDLRRQQLAGEQQVRALKDAYNEAKAATGAAADAEDALAKRLAGANRVAEQGAQVLRERNDALKVAKGELAAAGVATETLADAHRHLLDALNATGRATEEEIAAQKRVADERRAAAAEEERLAGIVLRSRLAMQDAARAEADGVIRDFDRMQAAERQAAQAAQEAANTIKQAFGAVGGKSVAELRAEIDKVRAAMTTLQNTSSLSGAEIDQAMKLGTKRINELERQVRAATGEMTLMDRASNLLNNTLGHVGMAGIVIAVVMALQRLAGAFVTANKEMEQTRLGFDAIYKNSATTAKQIEFLRATADRAGVSVGSISQSFVKFSASMNASNVPLETSNALFAAITQAAGTLGLEGDKVSHMLDALSQMAGKGTVSLEELRQQLGDSLPGALALVAKGLGITEQQMVKLIESGGLAARDLFPALTKALQSLNADVNTLSSGWERFKNFLTTSAQAAGDAGWADVLKGALVGITMALKPLLVGLVLLSEGIFNVVRMSAVAAGALVSGKGLSGAMQAASDQARESADRITAFSNSLDGNTKATTQTARAGQALATTQQGTAAATSNATSAVQTNTGALQQNSGAAGAAAQAHGFLATETEQAAAKTALASKNIVQIATEYAQLASQLNVNTQVMEKLVKARETDGQSLQAVAQLTANHRTELESATAAAVGNLQAQEQLLKARSAETTALRGYIAVVQEAIKLRGDPDGSRKRDLEERQKKLDLLAAEELRTKNAVEAGHLEVLSKQQARIAYEDLSGAVEQLRVQYENSRATQTMYEELQKQGFATQEQVNASKERASFLEGLYRDALKDTIATNELAIGTITNKNIVDQAAIQLDAERARSLESLAKATNNSTLETQAHIMGIEAEIKSRQKNADAMAAEAKQRLIDLDAMKAAQQKLGDWNNEKEVEYQKTKAGLEAKLKESDALKESTKSLDRQIQALRESQKAESDYAATIDKSTNAIVMKNKALEELYNRNRILNAQTTADGFTKNADGSAAGGFTNTLPIDQAMRLRQTGGKDMTPEEIATAIQQADAAFKDMQAFTRQNPGASSTQYQQDVTALENTANTARQGQNAGSIRTVKVQIGNGPSASIDTASQKDSDALVAMLRQLETQSRSAA